MTSYALMQRIERQKEIEVAADASSGKGHQAG
jgi:hypothetical protein